MNDLTKGNLLTNILNYAVPFMITCFLQTFYGMADLYITGQYNDAICISAVSIGSQVMHMITIIIVGLSTGCTVLISKGVGSHDKDKITKSIANSVILFSAVAIALMAILLLSLNPLTVILSVPTESISQTTTYFTICFLGIPFIVAYNVISGIFRGLGDTRTPMLFITISGIINILGDYYLIGILELGALGASIATVTAQAISVIIALYALISGKEEINFSKSDFFPSSFYFKNIIKIGLPIAIQECIIQVSFLVITAIANKRGVKVAAAVGIVKMIISFLFLIPSSMMSTISVVAAQNSAANKHARSKATLKIGILLCVSSGIIISIFTQIYSREILTLFAKNDPEVIDLGVQYLMSYVVDCAIAGIHFCFSGFFSAYGKSKYSFLHSLLSAIFVRMPGAYFASRMFPYTLFPMGLAAPLGSVFSSSICFYLYVKNRTIWFKND